MDEWEMGKPPVDRRLEMDRSSSRLATASLVLGIISILGSFCCLPFVLGALGIIFALLSKRSTDEMPKNAKTGLVCSIIGLVISIAFIIFTCVFSYVEIFNNPENLETFKDVYRQQYEQIYQEEMPVYMEDFLDNL